MSQRGSGIVAGADAAEAGRCDRSVEQRHPPWKERTIEPLPTLDLVDEIVGHARDEELSIQSWRAEQLRRLGLSHVLSEMFAGLVDWHEIAALVARGCPLELALEIVR